MQIAKNAKNLKKWIIFDSRNDFGEVIEFRQFSKGAEHWHNQQ